MSESDEGELLCFPLWDLQRDQELPSRNSQGCQLFYICGLVTLLLDRDRRSWFMLSYQPCQPAS